MSEISKGDRVKVAYEGVAERAYTSNLSGIDFVTLRRDDETLLTVRAKYVTVIEPAYEDGTVYQAADGTVYRRWYGRWHTFLGTSVTHEAPKRPLRKLVPEA